MNESIRQAMKSEGFKELSLMVFYNNETQEEMKRFLEARKESFSSHFSAVRYVKLDSEDELMEMYQPCYGEAVVYEFWGLGRKVNVDESKVEGVNTD